MTSKKKPVSDGIEPVDYKQCQAQIRHGVSAKNFMTMGGKIIKTERCSNEPLFVMKERKPGKDGKIGHMSVCESCADVFRDLHPDYLDIVVFTSIPGIAQDRWDALDEDTKRLFESLGMRRPG